MDSPASSATPHSPGITLRASPLLFEINAGVLLNTLARRSGRALTLADLPDSAIDEIVETGADAVWLMGVWERSAAGRQQALSHPGLAHEYRVALPDVQDADVVGSPYAVARYAVAPELGGEAALRALRTRLAQRGVGLLLDLVPNHVAIDHPWLVSHPDALVRGSESDLQAQPEVYFRHASGAIFAHGRDPYFPPWTDTAQLDAQSPAYRALLTETLLALTELCDGVRCDMAMLLVQRIFAQTWPRRDASQPNRKSTELWPEVITAARARRPEFLFLAEVYWDMEAELQAQGFDYTYDKRLYDRLCRGDAPGVRDHLHAELAYQQHSLRFIENHDEPRAMTALGPKRSQTAAVLTLTLPGARLLHEGQAEGRRIKLPVQLGRRPDEASDEELRHFYARLLGEQRNPVFHDGTFYALATRPFQGTDYSNEQLLAHAWRLADTLRVVIVNLSAHHASARLLLSPFPDGTRWRFRDALRDDLAPEFSAEELRVRGLPIFLEGHGAHLFVVAPA